MKKKMPAIKTLIQMGVLAVSLCSPLYASGYSMCETVIGLENGANPNNFPVVSVGTTTRENALTGAVSTVLREAYKRAGLAMDLQVYPSRRSIDMVNEGRVQAELIRAVSVEKKFTNLMRVNIPVYWSNEGVFYTDEKFNVDDYRKLKDVVVAYKQGVVTWESRVGDYDNVVAVNDDMQGIKMVSAARVDVFLDNEILGRRTIKHLGEDAVKHGNTLVRSDFYHYFHKDQKDLVPRVEKALKAMKEEGLLDEIVEVCEKRYVDEL